MFDPYARIVYDYMGGMEDIIKAKVCMYLFKVIVSYIAFSNQKFELMQLNFLWIGANGGSCSYFFSGGLWWVSVEGLTMLKNTTLFPFLICMTVWLHFSFLQLAFYVQLELLLAWGLVFQGKQLNLLKIFHIQC